MKTEICLFFALIACYTLVAVLNLTYKKNKMSKIISILFIELIIWCGGALFQKILSGVFFDNLIYFDYVTYIGTCSLFPTLLFVSYIYKNGDKKIPKKYLLLFVVPVICLIFLWTNDYHNLFFKFYSTNFLEREYGIVFYINTIYSYVLTIIFIFEMIRTSIQKIGSLSKQTAIILIGSVFPLVTNIVGITKIVDMSTYITPITFVVTLFCYAIAIFKYRALDIVPIALKTIIDTMTDAFVVISLDGAIINQNKEFVEKSKKYINFNNESENLFELLRKSNYDQFVKLNPKIKKCIEKDKGIVTEIHIFDDNNKENEKFFEISISLIKGKNQKSTVGVLILIKDITEHKKDMEALKQKQDIIVKQAQLVSIGELASGVAHDINTPISAIKTGITMLKASENPRTEEEITLIDTMESCSNKIISIVNSMRNQIRNLGGTTNVVFKVSSVIEDVKSITYHETEKYKAKLKITIQDDVLVRGDPAKLGQVLTNLVVNAAQAYKGTSGGKIDVIIEKGPNKTAIIKVIDYAGGIDDDVAAGIFKSMLTTKGVEGTGLGLYLAYSVIKGNFNGDINFDTRKGMGTTFFVKIPAEENI